jgi:hypothetical protein
MPATRTVAVGVVASFLLLSAPPAEAQTYRDPLVVEARVEAVPRSSPTRARPAAT